MRREYAGAARKAQLDAPLGGASTDLTIICDDLTGWPVGTDPFWIVIDRGKSNEEKILIEARSGDAMNVYTDGLVNGRGADGTTMMSHSFGAYVEHVFTATDADEANEHVNSEGDVHGVVGPIAGTSDTQTLTNKTISGLNNTLSDIRQADVINLEDDLADLEATKAPINSPTFTGNPVLPATTVVGGVSAAELQALDGVTSNVQAQITAAVNAAVAKAIADAKGDLLVGLAADSIGRLAVGPNDYILTADSSQTAGMKWASPAVVSGGLPIGGDPGQILAKIDGTNFNVEWIDAPVGGGVSGSSIIAVAPYPTGGTVTTYTDGVTGYQYRVHTFDYTGIQDEFEVFNGVIGKLLLIPGGGAGGSGANNGPFTHYGGGAGAGAPYEEVYAFGAGIHNMYVGQGGRISGTREGEDSYFEGYPGTVTATTLIGRGGGAGGNGVGDGTDGGSGGSGGSAVGTTAGGSATYGSVDGGTTTNPTLFPGEDGFGASGLGIPARGGGPNAGAGIVSAISGSNVTYCEAGPNSSGVQGTGPGSGGKGGAAGAGNPGNDGIDGQIVISYRIA